MIIVLKPEVKEKEINHIMERVQKVGLTPHVSKGVERTIIMVIGDERILSSVSFESFPGVDRVMSVLQPFKLVSREFKSENTIIKIRVPIGDGCVEIGGNKLIIIAGPCAVENRETLFNIAELVKSAGATLFRAGAFKPRTSPYSFQGLGEEGLKYLADVKKLTGLPVVTEVMDTRTVSLVAKYADVLQIGTRNMQNFDLLKEVGDSKKPVLLKRGMTSTVKEFLMAAEYIMSRSNYNVILCERGIRTYEDYTRNTLDLSAVAVIKHLSHLPVIVDPSHGTGKWRFVSPMSKAAIAAGADGLIIEVHSNPEEALSDGDQSLIPEKFKKLVDELKLLAPVVDRNL